MRRPTLVFTTCYNERDNIGAMIDAIVRSVPAADVLVVDDNSPDGTWHVLVEKRSEYPQLICVQRPRKLGIGSAHKYALFYAMREGYSTLLTMDADFSHDPRAIPTLLARHGPNVFVTGSRYCEGGASDYTGYRNLVSRIGNSVARRLLGVQLKELTTYFRVFDVGSVARLPLRHVWASGYSYGVQLVYYLAASGVRLREVPIHFTDRTKGASKIPRAQILWSMLDLVKLGAQRFYPGRDLLADPRPMDSCALCGDRVLALTRVGLHTDASALERSGAANALRRTRFAWRTRLPLYQCLRCGTEQVLAGEATAAGPAGID